MPHLATSRYINIKRDLPRFGFGLDLGVLMMDDKNNSSCINLYMYRISMTDILCQRV